MARPKTIPDSKVHSAVLALLAANGEARLSFAAVGRACGLAPATLVQRFGSQNGMVVAALQAGWDAADAALSLAEKEAGKGAHQFLKALPNCAELLAGSRRDADLRARAAEWRRRAERVLAMRLGNGARADQSAAMLYAIWQGQGDWKDAGGKGFRLKDAVKMLT